MRNKKQSNNNGFTQHLFSINKRWGLKMKENSSPNKKGAGFTLIELLVVVAIIALLTSIALISLMSARQKSRDVKRLSDMTQMNTALELYFATNKGYPSGTDGIPQNMSPTFLVNIPNAPMPPDGNCEIDNPTTGVSYNTYYYVASGTPYTIGLNTVYPDYNYYFCLGQQTGNFSGGPHILNPRGVR